MCYTARYLSILVALSLVWLQSTIACQHLVAGDQIAARLQAAAAEKTLVIVGVVVLVVVLLAAAIIESCKEQGAECLN